MSPEEILRWRLDHYDEEVKRLRSRLDEAQEIVVDLLATGERLAKIVDGQKASGLLMGDKDTAARSVNPGVILDCSWGGKAGWRCNA